MTLRSEALCDWARYATTSANIGYSQPNRRTIFTLTTMTPGAVAEADCSSLALWAALRAGLPTGDASYTGDMREALEAVGWAVIPYAATGGDADNLYPGDLLLSEAASGGVGHVAVNLGDGTVAEAWIDGQGDIMGSAGGDGPGDDTGGETRVVPFYAHPYTARGLWTHVLRPPAETVDGTNAAATPETPSIELEDTMHLIKTTTPWGATAYALVNGSLGGARAIDNSDGGELNAYIRMLGEPKWVEWDWYQLLIRRSWEMHNWLVGIIAGAVKVDIDEAVAKIINATKEQK